MKANELMIGDWVRNALLNEVFKMNTTSMRNMCWDEDNGMARYTIEPIPLTEEILKANFKEGAMKDFYYTDGIEIYVNEAGVNVVAKFGIYGSHLDYYCLYVHELQHALRLCGLNELADNFTVND